MLSVFPYVTSVGIGENLWILMGSDRPLEFDKNKILAKLDLPEVRDFLEKAKINIVNVRDDVRSATVEMYSQAKDGQPQQVNTDLFPRGEYYLNFSWD